MKPQHLHLATALILAIATVVVGVRYGWQSSILLAAGTLAALLHWKAEKSHIIE
jgi:glucose-6-phosphate-specific signal transduction histidine kinase